MDLPYGPLSATSMLSHAQAQMAFVVAARPRGASLQLLDANDLFHLGNQFDMRMIDASVSMHPRQVIITKASGRAHNPADLIVAAHNPAS